MLNDRLVKQDFRCAGCDIRQQWIFGPGYFRFGSEYCPSCSSLIRYILDHWHDLQKGFISDGRSLRDSQQSDYQASDSLVPFRIYARQVKLPPWLSQGLTS